MSKSADLKNRISGLIAQGRYQLATDFQECHLGLPLLSDVENLEGDAIQRTLGWDQDYARR